MPSPLYSSTDRPDLVEGAYATHTHTGDEVTSAVGSANRLATARTIRTNLASTSAASFDGTADVTPGVTGVLPEANGGTGATSLDMIVGRPLNAIIPYDELEFSVSESGFIKDTSYGISQWFSSAELNSNSLTTLRVIQTPTSGIRRLVVGKTTSNAKLIRIQLLSSFTSMPAADVITGELVEFGFSVDFTGTSNDASTVRYYGAFPCRVRLGSATSYPVTQTGNGMGLVEFTANTTSSGTASGSIQISGIVGAANYSYLHIFF